MSRVSLSEAGRSQELLDRKVRELYKGGAFVADDGKQAGACRQHRDWIFKALIFMKFRNWSCLEIECKYIGQFLDKKGAAGHRNKLK
jgi:hypothetical protein